MIDIHTHILPHVDDGARDLTESLDMARMAVADGLTHLFATPHHRDYTPLSRQEVGERTAQLQAELDQAGIPLTLLPGHEVRLYDDMFDDWDNHRAGPLGSSKYVLAEPLFSHYDRQTDAMLFELFERGYIPIMAHPERIRPIQDNLGLIEPFLAAGGLTQITATSLTGNNDWRAKKVAETMLRNGMAHIIASDAHHSYHRPPTLTAARDAAAAIVGLEQATAMVSARPLAIVKNEPIVIAPVFI
ncbi:MAG: capsular biosynthesis protein [Anaerolineae bacterium]|nr:capsular biosynthesis protein [Anaerolineae bacterium]